MHNLDAVGLLFRKTAEAFADARVEVVGFTLEAIGRLAGGETVGQSRSLCRRIGVKEECQ